MDGRINSEVAEDGIGLITIDRPDKRNAMTPGMVTEFTDAFERFAADDRIRAIILTGAGDKAFSAGHDIKSIAPGDLGHLYEEEHMQVFLLPRTTNKPVIAAVNGAAYAGGFCMAIACDLRLAVQTASFAIPAGRLGVVPIAGQSSRLPRLLPQAVVNEIAMAGRPLSAEQAAHFGFVSAVVAQENLMDEALKLARDIVAMSRISVEGFKRISREALFQGTETADAMEYWLAMEAGHGDDLEEGLAAFAEKRTPDFPSARAKK